MSPPLPPATTVRLPEDLTAWLDEKVRQGLYKSRSDAIRGLLEAVSEASPAAEATPPIHWHWHNGQWAAALQEGPPAPVSAPSRPFEWFVVPLVVAGPNEYRTDGTRFKLYNDWMAPGIPNRFVPFGLVSYASTSLLSRYMVSDIQIGGGADLLAGRRVMLEDAANRSRHGLPSRLIFDIPRMTTLECSNLIEVFIDPIGAPISGSSVDPASMFSASKALDHDVLLYPGRDITADVPASDAPYRYQERVRPETPVFRRLRDLLTEAGLAPRSESSHTPVLPRIGLLAVRLEHREELIERILSE